MADSNPYYPYFDAPSTSNGWFDTPPLTDQQPAISAFNDQDHVVPTNFWATAPQRGYAFDWPGNSPIAPGLGKDCQSVFHSQRLTQGLQHR